MKFISKILCIFLIISCSFACSKQEKTVVSFSSWGSESEIKIIKETIKDFESQNPDIKINFMHIPQNYFQKLHLLVVSNLTPDVMFVNNIDGSKYYLAGILEDLSPKIQKDDFLENSIKAFSSNGSIWAVPRDISNLVIYYNKDIFDKAKVDYPRQNWSMKDFLVKAKKLTNKQTWGFGFEKQSLFWLPFLWSNGGGILDKDASLILSKKNSKEALQFYIDLKNKYKVTPSDSEKGSLTNAQLFMQGKIAMHLNGRWAVPRFRKDIDFNWDIAKFPRGKNGSKVSSDASGWAINKNSKNKKAAYKFVKFLSSPATIKKFSKTGLIIPARKKVACSEIFLQKNLNPKNSIAFLESMANSKPTPVSKNYQKILDLINERLELAFNGTKKIDEVLDNNFEKKLSKEI